MTTFIIAFLGAVLGVVVSSVGLYLVRYYLIKREYKKLEKSLKGLDANIVEITSLEELANLIGSGDENEDDKKDPTFH